MIILTIRSDKPEAEIGLFKDSTKLVYETWTAHRQLAETIHQKMNDLLASQELSMKEIEAVICFKGPGSFTGLRIGLSVGNALAYGLQIPVVSTTGEDWCEKGIARLQKGDNETVALPEYGSEAHITKPKQ